MKCYGSTLSFLLFSSDFIYRYVPSSWTYCHPVRGVCSNSSSPCDSWSLRVQCIRGGGKSKTCENWLVLFLRLFYKKNNDTKYTTKSSIVNKDALWCPVTVIEASEEDFLIFLLNFAKCAGYLGMDDIWTLYISAGRQLRFRNVSVTPRYCSFSHSKTASISVLTNLIYSTGNLWTARKWERIIFLPCFGLNIFIMQK